ncbi:Mitochondrial distribution and morphology protein 10, variant 2 [Balamuthia mandrillaris]
MVDVEEHGRDPLNPGDFKDLDQRARGIFFFFSCFFFKTKQVISRSHRIAGLKTEVLDFDAGTSVPLSIQRTRFLSSRFHSAMQLNAGSAAAPFAPSLRVCYHSPLTSPAFEEVHFHPSASSPSSPPSSASSSSSASLSFLPDKDTLSSFHQRLKEKRQQQAQNEGRDHREEAEEEERPHIIELSAEREDTRSRALPASQQQHQQRLFSVSGEIEWDGTQQAEIVQQLSRRLSCKVWLAAAGGPFQKGQPPCTVMVSSLRYNGPTYTTRLSYTTEKEIFLVNLLKSVTPSVALGCELLYSNTEKKPGCSIGLRYATKEAGKPAIAATQFASSLSFLGHLDTSFTRLVLPNLFIAARHTYVSS